MRNNYAASPHVQGVRWEETSCKIERITMDESENDFAHLAVTETDELGMYAVVLCPKRDVKTKVKLADKVILMPAESFVCAAIA